jgi:hypothetical protein
MWISKSALFDMMQGYRLEGMREAADSLIRGLSPYYEGPDLAVPGKVAKAIHDMGDAVDKADDSLGRANAYHACLMLLGDAIGQECKNPSLQISPLRNSN